MFDEPDRFLVTHYAETTPAARHFAFGTGIYYCLGAPLARMEAEIIFRLLLERTSELALVGSTPPYRNHGIIRGLQTLLLRLAAWTARR